MNRCFVCLFFAVLISSCSGSTPAVVSSNDIGIDSADAPTGLLTDQKITIDGSDRTYDLFVPMNQTNSPLVVLLHGHRSDSADITGESGSRAPYKVWRTVAEENNVILLIPNGLVGSDQQTGWNDCRKDAEGNPDVDDVAFIRAAVDAVGTVYEIDREKVFATGTSNGGHMAIRLAQEAPDLVAAIGVVAALMPVNSSCPNSDVPISALFINGTEDPIAPYNGGEMVGDRGEVFSSDETVNMWLTRNSIDAVPEITTFPDLDSDDSSTVEKSLYRGGVGGTEVVRFKVEGGGHTEPSIAERYRRLFLAVVGNQNGDIEMAREVWSFFESKSNR